MEEASVTERQPDPSLAAQILAQVGLKQIKISPGQFHTHTLSVFGVDGVPNGPV